MWGKRITFLGAWRSILPVFWPRMDPLNSRFFESFGGLPPMHSTLHVTFVNEYFCQYALPLLGFATVD
jgi:hypothetical protein